jgi:SAM-dependent MidA family methyltransferase
VTKGARHIPWQQAWQQALYGPGGFYLRPEGPAGHFRTACHAGGSVLASALSRLAVEAGCTAIVDIGAGRGELLTALARLQSQHPDGLELPDDLPEDLFVTPPGSSTEPGTTDEGGGAGAALLLHGVDVVERPEGLPASVGWSQGLQALPDDVLDEALVVAWELLDVVPVPIAEVDDEGVPRIIAVDPVTGDEHRSHPLTVVEYAWCARWWPLVDAEPGYRIEIGGPRDALWADLVKRVARTSNGGLLLAVDYCHEAHRRPPVGSLSAFRGGRAVPPIPDGSCDLTSHVAMDSVAAAGRRAGATSSVMLRQRAALRALGAVITPGDLAAARASGTDALLAQLELRSQLDELLDESGLGGFCWLLQGVRHPVPARLT